MFWVDQIAKEISEAFPDKDEIIIRDEKTASGRVHIGSLRGVVIHGVVAEALNQMGRKATFVYEINDVDPMDGMPVYLDHEAYLPHMGKPLKDVPSPDEHGRPRAGTPTPTDNFARTYGNEFVEVIHKLGFNAKIIWASDCYADGIYDEWIARACENTAKIREIYKQVSGSEKDKRWIPLQIVCENCGKVGSTLVSEFDGKLATYSCEPNLVEWAQGCGHKGQVAPFKGRGKLPWKVEWAVKWNGLGVDVEGSGKDHNAAGGSHDVAERIALEALNGRIPFNIPYEFFLFGGAKMSASKGLGATAYEVSQMMPPELLRFLMVRTRPQQPIDFDITGDTIPRLYDNHDECARIYFGEESSTPELGRAYHFAQIDAQNIKERFFPRFSRIAFIVQIPHLNVEEEVQKMKGASLSEADTAEALERADYAREWLQNFAGENAKFEIQHEVPENAAELSPDQKKFLADIAEILKDKNLGGEALHAKIHELRKASPLDARAGFGAIYTALLGKSSGPQAGWFLDALERDFVVERFTTVAQLPQPKKKELTDAVSSLCIIKKAVREKFPGIKLGFNTLRGVKIQKTHPDFAALQQELWQGLDFEGLKKNSARLEAFREIYRGFGVKPSKNKPSPVALISRLANGKELPNINLAVDIYNALAVKHQLAIGLFNLDKIQTPIELRFAQGGEPFQGLGEDKPGPLNPGELCYFDAAGLVMARDFNHLDSELTKVDEHTTNILINVDGNGAVSLKEVEACLDELETLLVKYLGGELGKRSLVDAAF